MLGLLQGHTIDCQLVQFKYTEYCYGNTPVSSTMCFNNIENFNFSFKPIGHIVNHSASEC